VWVTDVALQTLLKFKPNYKLKFSIKRVYFLI